MNEYIQKRIETLKQFGIEKVELEFRKVGASTWYMLYWNNDFIQEWQGSDRLCKSIGEDGVLIATILGEDSLVEWKSGVKYDSEVLLFNESEILKSFKYSI